MQVELENWLTKYDDFMEFQNSKIEIIQDEYDAEKADYNELSARFAVLKGLSQVLYFVCLVPRFLQILKVFADFVSFCWISGYLQILQVFADKSFLNRVRNRNPNFSSIHLQKLVNYLKFRGV